MVLSPPTVSLPVSKLLMYGDIHPFVVCGGSSLMIRNTQMTHFQASAPAKHPAKVSRIVNLPQAQFLQGVTSIPSSSILLIADSHKGCVWRYKLKTKAILSPAIVYGNTMLSPGPDKFGVNGIDVYSDPNTPGLGFYLYYTNTGTKTLYRLRINPDGTVHGQSPDQIMMEPAGEGFAISSNGNMYVASYAANEVYYVGDGWWGGNQPTDPQVVSQGKLIGATSVAFGTGALWNQKIFVTTNGGPNGIKGSEGVSWIDVSSLELPG